MFKLLALLAIMLVYTHGAYSDEGPEGCACNNVGTTDALAGSDAVFSGRVQKIFPINADDYAIQIIVYQSWKKIDTKLVTVLSSQAPRDCGFEFVTGEEYLVYAFYPSFADNMNGPQPKQSKNTKNKTSQSLDTLVVSKCSPTAALVTLTQKHLDQLGAPIYSAEQSGQEQYQNEITEMIKLKSQDEKLDKKLDEKPAEKP